MKGCQIKYYYSFKIFLHFKLENPHTNPSQTTTVDQIWKLFAIIMKNESLLQITVQNKGLKAW